jgi:hypothetical protein
MMMRKMIFMALAGYLFKKFQGRKQTYGTRSMNRY